MFWQSSKLRRRYLGAIWRGKAVDNGDERGWVYQEHPVSAKKLKQVPTLTKEEWQPAEISEDQAVLLGLVGNDGIEKGDVLAEMAAIDVNKEQTVALIDDLIDKRFVGWDGETLVFLTHRCSTVFTPKGRIG